MPKLKVPPHRRAQAQRQCGGDCHSPWLPTIEIFLLRAQPMKEQNTALQLKRP